MLESSHVRHHFVPPAISGQTRLTGAPDMTHMARRSVAICGLLLLPTLASAQSATRGAISGTVRDTTGAVLPGVTAEASGPTLIERVRTATTDGDGRYNI